MLWDVCEWYHTRMPPATRPAGRLGRRIVTILMTLAVIVGSLVLVLIMTIGLRPSEPPLVGADTVIVVSPHPDDETYAMGQSVAAQALAGKRVIGVLVADGDSSRFVEWWTKEHGEDLDEDGDVDRWDFGLARREEYKEAMEILGADELVFLGGADSQGAEGFEDASVDSEKLVAALERVADQYPGATWFTTAKWVSSIARFTRGDFKNHPDHAAVADAVFTVADGRGEESYFFKVYAYFLPAFARFASVRIEGDEQARERKAEAVRTYGIIGATSTPELYRSSQTDPAEYLMESSDYW